jgi:hypothetical protein
MLPLPGTGHVPMTDDPFAVASLIGQTSQTNPGHDAVDRGVAPDRSGG